jgi:hypothetical protein
VMVRRDGDMCVRREIFRERLGEFCGAGAPPVRRTADTASTQ